jgi:hypothetical protein
MCTLLFLRLLAFVFGPLLTSRLGEHLLRRVLPRYNPDTWIFLSRKDKRYTVSAALHQHWLRGNHKARPTWPWTTPEGREIWVVVQVDIRSCPLHIVFDTAHGVRLACLGHTFAPGQLVAFSIGREPVTDIWYKEKWILLSYRIRPRYKKF